MTPFFQVFDSLQLPQQLQIQLEYVTILDATIYRSKQEFRLHLYFPRMIHSRDIAFLEKQMTAQIFPDQQKQVFIIPHFYFPADAATVLESYYDNILWELSNKQNNIPLLLLFKDAMIQGNGENVTLTTKNSFLYDYEGPQLKAYLQDLLYDRFDIQAAICIQLASSGEELENYRQYQQQKKAEICRQQPTPVITPKPSSLIYGKNTDGIVTALAELGEEEGPVLVQGRILTSECRQLKNSDKWMMIFALTDDTDSITVKLFLTPQQAKVLPPQLQVGSCIKVKGIISFDSFSREQCISHISGIRLIPEFRPKRSDTAPKKRVELHCHSKMSDMDGICDVKQLVKTAYRWGHKAIAITDHGVVHAFPEANHQREDLWKEHLKKCEQEGIDPGEYQGFFKVIYGVEGYLVNDVEDEEPEKPIKKKKTHHIIILAKNEIGRVNLYRLISKSHIDYYAKRPRIPKSELIRHREGLVIGSACEAGEVFQSILQGKDSEQTEKLADFYDYLEIQPIGNNRFLLSDDRYPHIQSESDLQELNRQIVMLGERLKKPVVATGDVHFLNPEDEVYRRIIMASKGFQDADSQAPLYFRTTEEMLAEFQYLGAEKAEEVVITNPNCIANLMEAISPVRPDKCPPVIENSDKTLRQLCEAKAHQLYGKILPPVVKERMDQELDAIIGHGYAVMYIIAQKLVCRSMEDGYLVGSRGSVGSSFAAFLAGITEVNSLPPHYRCPHCFYTDFHSPEVQKYAGGSGCDMPSKNCPQCGKELVKDGFDIPFETFLGFKGDKEPDIDLNFSGEYQAKAHQYTEEIFGKGQTFKAGTIGALADKTAYGIVRSYFENRGIAKRHCELERLAAGCSGVRRSTGQHPGGIVVLPKGEDINTFTPIQHPANDTNSDIITTHFDYHSIDHNLLKLDELGHDDPTMIRALQDLIGLDPAKIPLDDPKVMSLFTSPAALKLKPEDIFGWRVGTLGVPEFGTGFVENMLIEAQPTQFSDLIRIAGLGHGTDVWLDNAQELIRSGTCSISSAICCRDDIMVYLIHKGMKPATAFEIMEAVRKGKVAKGGCGKWEIWKQEMLRHGVPQWYIGSCEKIMYMFPKAHAAAYVMMAWRIAYCKLYYPLEYYTAYFSVRADNFSYETMCQGKQALEHIMEKMISNTDQLTKKEQDTLKDMRSVQEMYARGFEFVPIDLHRAKPTKFTIINGKIMPALTSIPGLGEKAAQNICRSAEERAFSSVNDLKVRAGIGDSTVALLDQLGILKGMPKTDQLSLFD